MKNIDTYVGCSMTSMTGKEYSHFRHTLLSICDELDTLGMKSYREPFEDGADGFDSPADVLEKDLDALDGATRFILIYTHKAASSALIELGYSWRRGIPIDIFHKGGVSLPYYLRDEDALKEHNISMHRFTDEAELPALIAKIFT